MIRSRLALALVVGAVVGGLIPSVAMAKGVKVDVCHRTGGGSFQLVSVAESAVKGHSKHGDGVPGGAVPMMTGYTFNQSCVPVPADTDNDGVLDDADNCPSRPNPDQLDQYGSTSGDACEDTDGDGTADVDETDICVSINGTTVVQHGSASCYSDLTTGTDPNVARAHGGGSIAEAFGGDGNTATASGGGYAGAEGNNNTAAADGAGSNAYAGGSYNTATASAGAYAWGIGSYNTAAADGAGAWAGATGSYNTVAADGAGSIAYAEGSFNTVTASAGGFAWATYPASYNTVAADGAGSWAYTVGSYNTATASGGWTAAAEGNNSMATATACDAEAFGDNLVVTCP